MRDCYGHQSERRPRPSNPLAQAATPLKVIIYTFHSNLYVTLLSLTDKFRWLKASGISITSEERMRQISREMIRGNVKGEIAPFSVSLKSGGEEIRGAALVYVPNLVEKVSNCWMRIPSNE